MNKIRGEKYFWHLNETVDAETLLQHASAYNLSIPIMQSVLARGYHSAQEIESYLFSRQERDVAHPALLKNAEKVIERIMHAIHNKEKILIFGDYDVDGITSSALMMLCLKPLGAAINFFLPNRMRDGYGLSVTAVERAAHNKYALIVTVDNGISAFEPAQKARELGIDLIITDHHRPHDHLPEAFAIVNPQQADCTYPFKYFAGVGVTFKLMSLLYEKLKQPMPSKALELLLLGTIADIVPLKGENRFWVRQGLHSVNKQESYAFNVLKKNGNVTRPVISATDIGYSIAPQINALGRLEDPRDGVKFLIGSDEKEIDHVGSVLLALNQERKTVERSIFYDVEHSITTKAIDIAKEKIILAASEHWPAGVIGLVASRLVGAYGKPTFLFHLTAQGKAKGSGRSIAGFNIFDALSLKSDLFDSFGGHAMAAGMSLDREKLPALKEHLETLVTEQLTADDLEQKIVIDAPLTLPEVNKKIIRDLSYLEPFGSENPPPIFYIKKVSLLQKPTLLKDAHVKCSIFSDGIIKPIIFFNRPEIFERLMMQGPEPFDVVVHISENHWQDKISIELIGIDISYAS